MTLFGMDRETGGRIEGVAYLHQRVATILTTPLGSRAMRRDFGSELPYLVDQNITPSLRMRLFRATVTALRLWEPYYAVHRVYADPADPEDDGTVSIGTDGVWLPDGQPIKLEGIGV